MYSLLGAAEWDKSGLTLHNWFMSWLSENSWDGFYSQFLLPPCFFKSRESKIITSLPEFLIRRMDTEAGEVPRADRHCSGNQAVLFAAELEKPGFLQACVTAEAYLMIGHLKSSVQGDICSDQQHMNCSWCSTISPSFILPQHFKKPSVFEELLFLH